MLERDDPQSTTPDVPSTRSTMSNAYEQESAFDAELCRQLAERLASNGVSWSMLTVRRDPRAGCTTLIGDVMVGEHCARATRMVLNSGQIASTVDLVNAVASIGDELAGYERGVAFMREQLEIGQQRRDITDETRGHCADLLGCEPSDVVLGKERCMASRAHVLVLRAKIGGMHLQELKEVPDCDLEDDALAADEFEAQVYRDLARRIKAAREPVTHHPAWPASAEMHRLVGAGQSRVHGRDVSAEPAHGVQSLHRHDHVIRAVCDRPAVSLEQHVRNTLGVDWTDVYVQIQPEWNAIKIQYGISVRARGFCEHTAIDSCDESAVTATVTCLAERLKDRLAARGAQRASEPPCQRYAPGDPNDPSDPDHVPDLFSSLSNTVSTSGANLTLETCEAALDKLFPGSRERRAKEQADKARTSAAWSASLRAKLAASEVLHPRVYCQGDYDDE